MPMGQPCKYNKEFVCYKWGEECLYPALLDCLKINVLSQIRELDRLKATRMEKHTTASIKWRNTAFYYKKKAKYLEAFCIHHKLEIPPFSELARIFSDVKAKESVDSIFKEIRKTKVELMKGELPKKEDNYGEVLSDGTLRREEEGLPDNSGSNACDGGEGGKEALQEDGIS